MNSTRGRFVTHLLWLTNGDRSFERVGELLTDAIPEVLKEMGVDDAQFFFTRLNAKLDTLRNLEEK